MTWEEFCQTCDEDRIARKMSLLEIQLQVGVFRGVVLDKIRQQINFVRDYRRKDLIFPRKRFPQVWNTVIMWENCPKKLPRMRNSVNSVYLLVRE